MSGDSSPQGLTPEPRRDRGQIVWRIFLNAILVGAFVLAAIPIVAIIRGFIDLVAQSKIRSGGDWLAYGFAFTGLFLGAVFFAYAVKYYLSTAMVLLTTLFGGAPPNGSGHASNGSPNPTAPSRMTGHRHHFHPPEPPFVSVHPAPS